MLIVSNYWYIYDNPKTKDPKILRTSITKIRMYKIMIKILF
jgi:hypothetical protein